MKNRFNKKGLKGLRQNLRNNMPPAERVLWRQLQGKQLDGFKFRRQHSIDEFIVDFYCPKANLAIEVDGDSHYGENERKDDTNRQSYLESLGIRVLRFTNKEISERLEGVIEQIKNILKEY